MLLKLNLQRFASETWVLNESLDTSTNYDWNVNFICNGHNCTVLSILKKDQGVYITYDGDAHGIYLYGQWGSTDEWKTFVFETAPTGDLLTWLQANGTKQASQQTIEKGTYVWNDIPSTISEDASGFISTQINFVSNGNSCTSIYSVDDGPNLVNITYSGLTFDETVYYQKKWIDVTYKTIEVTSDTQVVSDFYTWFTANTTKQATEITYTCKWYLDGTLVNTSTFTHEKLTGVDYYALGSVFKVMLSAETLAQYDYGVNLNSETSNASLGTDNVITIEAFKGNIVFNITTNGKTTLATKNTYVPSDIDFNVNVPSTEAIKEVSTSSAMTAKLVESNVGKYYKYTGTTDDTYTNGDIYLVVEETLENSKVWQLNDTLTGTYLTPSGTKTYFNDGLYGFRQSLVYDGTNLQYKTIGTTSSFETVYSTTSGWTNEKNKLLGFVEEPSGDLLTWLKANGKPKPIGSYSVTFSSSVVSSYFDKTAFTLYLNDTSYTGDTLTTFPSTTQSNISSIRYVSTKSASDTQYITFNDENGNSHSTDNSTSYTGDRTIILFSNITSVYFYQHSCLDVNTNVDMYDGTTKKLKDIVVGDVVKSWDFVNNKVIGKEIVKTNLNDEEKFRRVEEHYKLTFSDGTIINHSGTHRFYNLERKGFVYTIDWNIGEHTYKNDGTLVSLVSREIVKETMVHGMITMEDYTCYFANGLMTGDRRCPSNIILGE